MAGDPARTASFVGTILRKTLESTSEQMLLAAVTKLIKQPSQLRTNSALVRRPSGWLGSFSMGTLGRSVASLTCSLFLIFTSDTHQYPRPLRRSLTS